MEANMKTFLPLVVVGLAALATNAAAADDLLEVHHAADFR
jgi:hypothetical protein